MNMALARITLFILFALQSFFATTVFATEDIAITRYREYLFRTALPNWEWINQWANSVDSNGQWTDLDYRDESRANWKVSKHLERLRELSLAWSYEQSPRYHDPALWKIILLTLDHWLEKRYQNPNWWHNQIGVPRHMRDILVLIGNRLDEQRFRQALEVLGQHRVLNSGAGANLIWSADLGLHYGLLAGDDARVKKCRDLMVNEVVIQTGEGIQPDNSFHQHSKRLQMFQYGKAFLLETARVAWQLRGTPLAFPEDKIRILSDFVLEGWQWMARGVHTVPGTMDRSSTRKGELRGADLRPLLPFLRELHPERAEAYTEMETIQNGKSSLSGYRYYPYSDFAVFHRPHFSFFLKTISSRTLHTESFNGENLKGKLLNSGDAYLISTGDEYFDLMPAWDWMKLPGVTAFASAEKAGRSVFTGSVCDGISGLSAMDYIMTGDQNKQVLTAKKSWMAHNDVVVCLIAGISAENIQDEIYTALDQCRLQGDITVNSPGNRLGSETRTMQKVKWIHHGAFAYIPLYSSVIEIHQPEVLSDWKSINRSETAQPVTEKVFLPVLKHGSLKGDEPYGYVLAYAPTPGYAATLAKKPEWKVIRNNKDCQAVWFNDGTTMVSFFTPGKVSFPKGSIEVDKPCLLMFREDRLYISDPSHQGGPVRIKWNNKDVEADLPDNGITLRIAGSDIP